MKVEHWRYRKASLFTLYDQDKNMRNIVFVLRSGHNNDCLYYWFCTVTLNWLDLSIGKVCSILLIQSWFFIYAEINRIFYLKYSLYSKVKNWNKKMVMILTIFSLL